MPKPNSEENTMGTKLTVQQVADLYGMSTRTIRRYIADGRLTAHRVGPKLIRLDATQVENELFRQPVA
jgi:excisionase family DNA binding protein